MKYFVYAIKSEKDGSFYKGITDKLERRIRQHNSGKNRSTKSKIPYNLVYFEECEGRIKAREREKYFKSGSGREFLKKLLS